MSEQICQLCGEAPSQKSELIENWPEIKKKVKVIFKINVRINFSASNLPNLKKFISSSLTSPWTIAFVPVLFVTKNSDVFMSFIR